ncbi:MAG TPA: hypothetical protein ENJ01_04425 [Gammaproteobacteria bacterium]|nr:hypothetical protein [Gammaproteobacteria bacterium]
MARRTAYRFASALPVLLAVFLLAGCATSTDGPSKYAPRGNGAGYYAPVYPYYYPYYTPTPMIDSVTVNPVIVK